MRDVAYVTVDVFTTRPFAGNPLAVIPDARGIDGDAMQRIAAEFNYSETAFVLPPEDPANTARVRIFTPTDEIPFAGHPNVGTGFVLGRQGEVFGRPVESLCRFEEEAGLVEVRLERRDGQVAGARIRAPRPLRVGGQLDPGVVARCASLTPADLELSTHPPVLASVGLPFALVQVTDLDALARARPDAAAFADADRRHPGEDDRFSLFLYASQPGEPGRLRARMFAPLSNILEDPATGSASAALGAYLASLAPEPDLDRAITIEQGVEMGRPSRIEVAVRKAGGAVGEVTVAGECVGVMRGTLTV